MCQRWVGIQNSKKFQFSHELFPLYGSGWVQPIIISRGQENIITAQKHLELTQLAPESNRWSEVLSWAQKKICSGIYFIITLIWNSKYAAIYFFCWEHDLKCFKMYPTISGIRRFRHVLFFSSSNLYLFSPRQKIHELNIIFESIKIGVMYTKLSIYIKK